MDKPLAKIIVVCGSTATGKSDLAVILSRIHNGEVVSADSRQVYKGLNIGSGKITKKEMRGVRHHMLDVVHVKKVYSVADYVRQAKICVEDILSRGKVPIICGGTGQYIDALVYGTEFPEVPVDTHLRKKLEKINTEDLYALLCTQDRRRAKDIDKNNRVRLIRALEITATLGTVPKIKKQKAAYDTLWIGLTVPKEILQEKIKARLLRRMRTGMMREIAQLHAKGTSWRRLESLGLEYLYGALFLQKKITKEEMLTELQNKIWQYSKRQMTWFKRNEKIIWLDPRTDTNQALLLTKNFLT